MPGRAGGSPQGLIHRHDLIAALDRAAKKQVTIVSAPAGSGKTSLLRSWSEHNGNPTAYLSIRTDQYDAQLFWLALLDAVRRPTGNSEPPPTAPGFNGPDAVRSELAAVDGEFVLIIDDLHELSSAEALAQLTALLRTLSADGWEQTEWVEANFALFRARLPQGDKALAHLTSLVADASEANLMSYAVGGVAGAAQNIYSFDGNAGGGLTVDLTWAEGRLEHATIHPSHHPSQTGPHRIRYGEDTLDLTLTSQEPITISAS